MAGAKGPDKIKARTVKGHATEDMVAKGFVRGEDKKGNDHADTSAGKGSHAEQKMLN